MKNNILMDVGDYHALISCMINAYYHLDYEDKIESHLADNMRKMIHYFDDKYLPFSGLEAVQ